ncbi:MAG: branched-chain amino acid ABC transporter permease, partial [Candidatus Limnocylindrales bacterium]
MRARWGRLRALARAHRSLTVLVVWAIIGVGLPFLVLIPPLSWFQPQKVWIDGFAFSGIQILLALGLNIVVGLAGLLDLGYAAFFA